MVTNQDPVAAGYVDSLARPGGNTTGVTNLTRELSGKRLELLKRLSRGFPASGSFGILTPKNRLWQRFQRISGCRAVVKDSVGVVAYPRFESGFRQCVSHCRQSARERRHHAFAYSSQSIPKEIAGLAIKHRLPSMGEIEEYAEAGGLVTYSAKDDESYVRAAAYVDKILKGAKPADYRWSSRGSSTW